MLKGTANILIAIKEQLIAEGIKALLERKLDCNNFLSEIENEEQLLAFCKKKNIDIIILDMDCREISCAHFIQQLSSREAKDVPVLLITKGDNKRELQKAVAAGAKGVVLKSSGIDNLCKALQSIKKDGYFFCDKAVYKLVHNYIDSNETNIDSKGELLTDRELEVLELICQEFTNREIAEKLQISVRTVDSHRSNLLKKTDSKNTVGLVKYAFKNNLVDTS
ncbi:response regulator transcription factor [Aliifodinibius sp. S!AR15-10]|uniref:response regulator transcription factor n=1 Tax=Aliifodinibius sp. S!AR15-10 TaxID=2950437 RepID=UPI00286741F9|nr:response regulator transcription factor [Aliifodinibius sp. S!AR15-10]MDR8389622.1 response regulator transcription factor [Aliifodinibius sp. S!AR15-10]